MRRLGSPVGGFQASAEALQRPDGVIIPTEADITGNPDRSPNPLAAFGRMLGSLSLANMTTCEVIAKVEAETGQEVRSNQLSKLTAWIAEEISRATRSKEMKS